MAGAVTHAAWRAAPIVAIGAAAAWIGFGPADETRLATFVDLGVPIVVASALVAAVAAALAAWQAWRRERPAWGDAAAALLLAAIVVATAALVPGRMRVQADEYQVAGTALGLRASGKPIVATAAFVTPDGGVHPIATQLDKRGVLLPALLAAAGSIDARPGRLVAVNGALAWLALLLCYAVLRQWHRPGTAVALVVPFATFPAFAWASRSLGLETLNLALLAAAALLSIVALRRRDAAVLLALAWTGALLSHARYESVIAGALFWGLAAVLSLRGPGGGGLRWGIALASLGFVPFAWQRAAAFEHGPDVDPSRPFGFEHFFPHFGTAVSEWFTDPAWMGRAAPVLAVAAIAGVAIAVREAVRGGWREREYGAALALAAVACSSAAVLAYHWGDFSHPNTARLALPANFLVLALAAIALAALGARSRPVLFALSAAIGGAGLAAAAADAHYRALSVGPALNAAAAWRAANVGCRVAWVTPYAGYFVVSGETAFSPWRLAELEPVLGEMVRRGEIGAVLHLAVGDRDGAPYELNVPPDGVPRRPLARIVASDITTATIELLDTGPGVVAPAAPCAIRAPRG